MTSTEDGLHENQMNSHAVIDQLYQKYNEDPYMISKINSYICTQLPNIIENIKLNHYQRALRMEELTSEQDTFIQTFLTNNQYFYVSATDKYFFYDGLHYHIISEDDILHKVLSTISNGRNLMSWKQRTKISIMKRIRENVLTNSIPESETIQLVLDALYPSLFASRNEAKYFLTILGDNIRKKNTSLIHYIPPSSKNFIRELTSTSQFVLGCNLSQTFKHKFHEHTYSECRMVNINNAIKHDHSWTNIINQYALDILCVACHYSIRYESSDNYLLMHGHDDELTNHVFYLKDKTQVDIVNQFITSYLDIHKNTSDVTNVNVIDTQSIRGTQITWKNMQYLWKHYLDACGLPSVMFLQTFKTLLTDKLLIYYNTELDTFIGICSKHLPAIQTFLSFWDNTIIMDDAETDFEIDEIVTLFRKWCDANNITITTLNDKQILDIIAYFFPLVEIERDKYLTGIRCSIWDKQMDIQTALDNMKELLRETHSPTDRPTSPSITRNIAIYDAYIFYCKYYANTTNKSHLIVSKAYFEKYVFDNLIRFVMDDKFLSCDWYMV
jgi:hypothetical protein